MIESEFRLDGGQIASYMRGSMGPAWQATHRLANQVRNLARSQGYVPVDKGKLRASIEVEMRDENGPVAYVGANTEYAVYVHEGYTRRGGRKIAGRPFLKRALDDVMARNRGK